MGTGLIAKASVQGDSGIQNTEVRIGNRLRVRVRANLKAALFEGQKSKNISSSMSLFRPTPVFCILYSVFPLLHQRRG
jgi:hypothetical protein